MKSMNSSLHAKDMEVKNVVLFLDLDHVVNLEDVKEHFLSTVQININWMIENDLNTLLF
jgi:hypothetical protein